MRLEIFKWIEKTFGILYPGSAISFSELSSERIEKGRRFRFTEISFTIKIKDAPKSWIDIDIHEKWKFELANIVSPGSEDRLNVHFSKSEDHVTPTALDFIKGSDKEKLLIKYSLVLSVNIFKKKEI